MRIKEVEESVGITKKNIRFYEKEGLLCPNRELENSYRDYTYEDISRLKIIKLLRKLDMPISTIRSVLDGQISLREALHLHELLLEEQQRGIRNAQHVCRLISEDGANVEDLNAEKYLLEIQRAEENSTILVDIQRKDYGNKYRETIIVSTVIVAILLTMASVLLFSLSRTDNVSLWAICAVVVVILLLFIGVVAALISRLKEIKGGEENDLGNY